MAELLLKYVAEQASSDNNVRRNAELQFSRLASEDPSSTAYFLMDQASNQTGGIDVRQQCLLHLKQMVPKYWSMGFASFVGPPINPQLKQAIRSNLLELSTSIHSKIRSGAAYVIVQIAAADYPDEWPDLMKLLFEMSGDYDHEPRIIGALTVFTDLFDDLITEDQFWEGGVGNQVGERILKLLTTNVGYETKSMAVKLYENVCQNFQSQEAFNSSDRKQYVIHHINQAFPILLQVLNFNANDENQFVFKTNTYKVLRIYIESFDKKIDANLKSDLFNLSLTDFSHISTLYATHILDSDTSSSDKSQVEMILGNLLKEILDTINAISSSVTLPPGCIENFNKSLLISATLPQDSVDNYKADINEYVTEITGLNLDSKVRQTIFDLLSEINQSDAKLIFEFVKNLSTNSPSLQLEAQIYLFECIIQNEASFDTNAIDLLNNFSQLINCNSNPLLIGRCFLMLPYFFEKFESVPANEFGVKALINMIKFATDYDSEDFEIVKFSALVSITLYKNLLEFETCFDQSIKHVVQEQIFKLTYSMVEESDSDSLATLLDTVTAAIIIDPVQASKILVDSGVNVIDLIFKVSFKDSANIQLTISATECLQTLLEGISIENYIGSCERSLPFIYNIINNAIAKSNQVEYAPELYLSLELLSIIIKSVPQGEIPDSIFQYTFPIIKTLILSTTDNQILQSAGEVFNNMLKRASTSFVNYSDPNGVLGMNSLLEIVSKFLSPELSDSAAMNTGLIILTLTKQFQSYLGFDFLSQILVATANRLVIAKETITIENLIMVFCNLVLSSPEELINFLSNSIEVSMSNGQKLNALDAILPIWFNSFEVTRGYEKIKQNALALGKIFILGDSRVENLIVNGDIIPYDTDKIITRSMSNSLPDRFTQIPASLKILKLLIGELSFQNQQPNAEEYLPIDQNDEDDEGWEDLDSVGVPNFEKLQSFVDDDGDNDKPSDDSLNQLLQTFFRECIAKNLGNFQRYYEMLSDDEKKVVTEYVAF